MWQNRRIHYDDVRMGAIASQITSLTILYSIVYSDVDQRKHQSSASLAFVQGIHRGPVNSPHKWPVTRKMFPFDDVIMEIQSQHMYGIPTCDFPPQCQKLCCTPVFYCIYVYLHISEIKKYQDSKRVCPKFQHLLCIFFMIHDDSCSL